jgi:menaquinone-dependent protoporphyrinogen oxidase
MARVLIPYGTTEGQTAKIANVIADVIRDRGHKPTRSTSTDGPIRRPTVTTQ